MDTAVIPVSEVIASLSREISIDDLSVSGVGIEELVVDLYRQYRI